jgi:hypothetical protein
LKKKKELKLQVGGTATGYQNPLDYQVKTFQKEGEQDVRVPFLNNQAQFKVPEGFTERGTTTSTTDLTKTTTTPVQSVQPQPLTAAPTTAKGILQREGIGSAKDILGQVFFEKSDDVLAAQGKTRAQDIIEQEQKIQESKRASEQFTRMQQMRSMQEEAEFQKKEKEFIDNLDPKKLGFDYKPIYNTKFGEIDFSQAKFSVNSWAGHNTAANITIGKDSYVFIPEEYVYKGVRGVNAMGWKDQDRQGVNTAFLDQKHWDMFLDKTQYINLEETSIDVKSLFPFYGNQEAPRGFLAKSSDLRTLLPADKFRNWAITDQLHGGEVLGLANYNGKLVYATANRQQAQTSYIGADGKQWSHWTTRKKGLFEGIPIIGKPFTQLATGIAETFAQIPGGAEIAYLLAGGPANPSAGYLYASLKALEVAGKGGSLEQRLLAAGVAYVSKSPTVQVYGNKVAEFLQANDLVTNATLAKAAGGAIVGSAVNGMTAAATGGNVKEAMAVGAVGGGLSLTSREVASTLVGGIENLEKLAAASNIHINKLTAVITGSVANGAIASIKGQDFLTAFGNNLIAEGMGQYAASNLVKQLEGSFSKETLAEIEKNTKNIISATARAAVRGEDLETALKAVTARSVVSTGGSILGKTLGELRANKKS